MQSHDRYFHRNKRAMSCGTNMQILSGLLRKFPIIIDRVHHILQSSIKGSQWMSKQSILEMTMGHWVHEPATCQVSLKSSSW